MFSDVVGFINNFVYNFFNINDLYFYIVNNFNVTNLLMHFSLYVYSCNTIVLPLFTSIVVFIYLCDFFIVFSLNNLSIFIVVGMCFFWLVSGFVFFLNRYNFGKFTGAIQRFWNSSFIYFWLVEACLFGLFYYYYLNSSQEPIYFYDEAYFNNAFLICFINFYISYLLLVFVLLILLYLLLVLNNLIFVQISVWLIFFIISLTYMYLSETYQFYYILNLFNELEYSFNNKVWVWFFNAEDCCVSVNEQYFYVIYILNYWHFMFIFLSSVFCVMRSFEQQRVHYAVVSFLFQNLFILFLLNFCLNVQIIKWIFGSFFELVYLDFFVHINLRGDLIVFSELWAFILSFFFF